MVDQCTLSMSACRICVAKCHVRCGQKTKNPVVASVASWAYVLSREPLFGRGFSKHPLGTWEGETKKKPTILEISRFMSTIAALRCREATD